MIFLHTDGRIEGWFNHRKGASLRGVDNQKVQPLDLREYLSSTLCPTGLPNHPVYAASRSIALAIFHSFAFRMGFDGEGRRGRELEKATNSLSERKKVI